MKIMNNLASRQQGMTSLGWLIVLSIIGFFALIFIKLLPVYMGDMEVKSSLEAITTDEDVRDYSTRDFRRSFAKRMLVSSFADRIDPKDIIVKKNRNGSRELQLKYETRVNFSGNIYIVVAFEHEVDIPRG